MQSRTRRITSRHCLVRLVPVALAWSLASGATAQNVSSLLDDLNNLQRRDPPAAMAGDESFGERVDMKTGQTVFRQVDMTIPSNGQLSLTVSRTLSVSETRLGIPQNPSADGPLMGNWEIEVPHISGYFDESTGWVTSQAVPSRRCTPDGVGSMHPPTLTRTFFGANHEYDAFDYWSGLSVSLPGKAAQLVLRLLASSTRPSDGASYHWGTRESDRISCVQQIKNGVGEGFRLRSPDGLIYTFDWMASRRGMDLEDTKCSGIIQAPTTTATGIVVGFRNIRALNPRGEVVWAPSSSVRNLVDSHGVGTYGGGSNVCEKKTIAKLREQILFATRVEDRFGNWVAFEFDPANPRRLIAMRNNEGASILVSYNSVGKVESVTDGVRTVRYGYGGTAGTELISVTRPDATQWRFGYAGISKLVDPKEGKVRWFDCEPGVTPASGTVSMVGPGGASADFEFTRMLHGTDRTPGGCYVPNPDRPNRVDLSEGAMAFRVNALVAKRVVGAGIAPAVWSYRYAPSWSWNDAGYEDSCSGPTCASGVSVTEVTRPDGTSERYTFGNDYFRNVGQLLSKVLIEEGRSLREERYEYMGSSVGQSFPESYGLDPLAGKNNPLLTEKVRPLIRTTVVQDGTSFVREVEMCGAERYCLDGLARPTKSRLYNSAGHFKHEEISLHDDEDDWVLGGVASVRDPVNGVELSGAEYDQKARPTSLRAFGQLTQRSRFNADGTLNARIDAQGNTLQFSNWRAGQAGTVRFPPTRESPNGASQLREIDYLGRVLSQTNEVGGTSRFAYDPMGRIEKILLPQDGVNPRIPTYFSYHQLTEADWRPSGISVGQWRIYEGTGNRAKFTYLDSLQRPVLIQEYDTSNVGKTINYIRMQYDLMGRIVFESYPQRSAAATTTGISRKFDGLGRLIEERRDSELGGSVSIRKRYLQDLTVEDRDELQNLTLTEYQAWDEPRYDLPIYQAAPAGIVSTVDRHPSFGWPLAISRQRENGAPDLVRRRVYDAAGRLCKLIEPETGATVFGHDENGRVIFTASGLRGGTFEDAQVCSREEALASGRGTRITRDALGRPTASTKPDGRGDQQLTYTPDGLLESVRITNSGPTDRPVVNSYEYDDARTLVGEKVSQPGWYSWEVRYVRDGLGSVSTIRYPSGLEVEYAPNALGQATRASGFASEIEHNPDGSLRRLVYGNGLVYERESNVRGLPSRISTSGVVDLSLNYDAVGNVKEIIDNVAGATGSRFLSYDVRGRLTRMEVGGPGGSDSYSFAYDSLDNITRKQLPGSSEPSQFIYDENNLLDLVVDGSGAVALDLEWDADGNLSRRGDQQYRFDSDGRLRDVGGVAGYRYDGGGNRVQATYANGRTMLWLNDIGGRQLFASDWMGLVPTDQKVYQNVFVGSMLVATLDSSWPSKTVLRTRYHHPDHLGSPVAVTGQDGAVIGRNTFGPFGEANHALLSSAVGFSGHGIDSGSSLTLMGARYYDAAIGRFVSPDPVFQSKDGSAGFNRYQYAANNPLTLTDPSGKAEVGEKVRAALSSIRQGVNAFAKDHRLGTSLQVYANVSASHQGDSYKVSGSFGRARYEVRETVAEGRQSRVQTATYAGPAVNIEYKGVKIIQVAMPTTTTRTAPGGGLLQGTRTTDSGGGVTILGREIVAGAGSSPMEPGDAKVVRSFNVFSVKNDLPEGPSAGATVSMDLLYVAPEEKSPDIPLGPMPRIPEYMRIPQGNE